MVGTILRNVPGIAGALAILGTLASSAVAHARPEPIPKPVAEPGAEESPATGQEAPEDPEEPPVIEPPEGLDCVEGEEQSDCDPDHEGGPEGQRPGNEPPDAWYEDMSMQMYNLQESLYDMAKYGEKYDPYIGYYATWMMSVVQQYYSLGYYYDGRPREYSYGYMTRGDFNYYYYYWMRPIYYSLLYYSAEYYESHGGSPQIPEYKSTLRDVAAAYQGLTACNYGFNGDDADAREDLLAKIAEQRAGL